MPTANSLFPLTGDTFRQLVENLLKVPSRILREPVKEKTNGRTATPKSGHAIQKAD
jgi:hypothetical protein